MNLSDCKTIEQYREAAHYWQKKWEKTDALLKEVTEAYIEFFESKMKEDQRVLKAYKEVLEARQ